MLIPRKIKVGGHNYRVILNYEFKNNKLLGECSPTCEELRIASHSSNGDILPRSMIEAIFLHELLHAIDYVYNSESLKEKEVDSLAEGIFQVFNDAKLFRGKGCLINKDEEAEGDSWLTTIEKDEVK